MISFISETEACHLRQVGHRNLEDNERTDELDKRGWFWETLGRYSLRPAGDYRNGIYSQYLAVADFRWRRFTASAKPKTIIWLSYKKTARAFEPATYK